MTQIPQPVGLGGGLNLVSPAIATPPGHVRGALNHEPLSTGYARVEGYERFDGRPAPSSAVFYRADFANGTADLAPGNMLEGADSGATATLLTIPVITGGDPDFGDATGVLALVDITGTFIVGEVLELVGSPVATIESVPVAGVADGADEYYTLLALAQDNLRADITAIPGSGPVRGVGELNGVVYGFRDNLGGTAGQMYRATSTGWQLVDLGRSIQFDTGSGAEIVEGNTITGATSGATAVVRRVVKTSGSWSVDAAGYMVVSGQAGTFTATENLQVGGVTRAKAVGNSAATTLPPGGRYICQSHNFYATSSFRRMYGCNGVGPAFEFDGTYFTPITTGSPVDTPNRLFIYQQMLFLAFAGGSLQNSAPGEPLNYDAVFGAFETGVGSDITDGLEGSSTALLIFTDKNVWVLSGTDDDTFALEQLTQDVGALSFTAQRVGQAAYLDQQGLRSIAASQSFGGFSTGTLTELVQPLLKARYDAGQRPIGSVVCKSKTQYRLFWPDGTGLHVWLGGKTAEALPVQVDFQPTCLFRCDMADGSEGIFIGASNGFVYRMDRGTSFDGAGVTGYLRMPYNHCKHPSIEKRFHRLEFELATSGRARLSIAAEFGPGRDYPMAGAVDFEAFGMGGLWDIATWDDFLWDGDEQTSVYAHVDGLAKGIAPLVICQNLPTDSPYTLGAYTPNWSPRRTVR